MMPYTKEEVEDVKRIDLLTYLQIRRPDELIRTGLHEYRTVTHSSLVISNGKWRWCREGIGGTTALNHLIKVENYSFLQAMQELSELSSPQPVAPPVSKPREPPPQRKRGGVYSATGKYHPIQCPRLSEIPQNQ